LPVEASCIATKTKFIEMGRSKLCQQSSEEVSQSIAIHVSSLQRCSVAFQQRMLQVGALGTKGSLQVLTVLECSKMALHVVATFVWVSL
jgi:hypothetical protein